MCKKLYVVDPSSNLYTMDPVTASLNLEGFTGIGGITDIAFHGPTLYGITFFDFLRLDPDTGAAIVVGPVGFSVNSLAVASTGIIYAGTLTGELITINPVTGAGTLVGPFGSGLTSAGDLAFDSNDVLYASLIDAGGTGVLATVDVNTGAASPIGAHGIKNLYGLAFCCCRLFGVTDGGELWDINVGTATGTFLNKNGVSMWGFASNPCCCDC